MALPATLVSPPSVVIWWECMAAVAYVERTIAENSLNSVAGQHLNFGDDGLHACV